MSFILPYSCLLLSICSAHADLDSLFFMYRVCSWYLALNSACLPNICLMACVACDFLYLAFFVFWDGGMFFLFYVLRCRCGGSECYVYIGVLEKIGDCTYFWTTIGESGPEFVFLIRVLVCFLLYPLVQFLEQLWYVVFYYCLYCLPFLLFLFGSSGREGILVS